MNQCFLQCLDACPRGLNFSLWGCYGLCLRNKPTELDYSFFLLCFCVCFLSSWPFQLYFILWTLPMTLRFLTLFLWSYFCLFGLFNYFYESLSQPWCNSLWLTGLKALTARGGTQATKRCYIQVRALYSVDRDLERPCVWLLSPLGQTDQSNSAGRSLRDVQFWRLDHHWSHEVVRLSWHHAAAS